MKSLKQLDLLIIDIDDSFIYHRTVAVANRLFLQDLCSLFNEELNQDFFTTKQAFLKAFSVVFGNIHRFRPRKKQLWNLIVLSGSGFLLHLLNIAREAANIVGGRMSNRAMIYLWADTVKSLDISYEEYLFQKETIKKNINPEIMQLYTGIRDINKKMYVAAISQNFSVSEIQDPIESLLKIGLMKANKFHCSKKGRINDYEVVVGDGQDKKKIAEQIIKDRKPKKIGMIIDDYEDLELLKLRNIKAVIYTSKIERFIDKNKYDIALQINVG